jgi:hypothetical protein
MQRLAFVCSMFLDIEVVISFQFFRVEHFGKYNDIMRSISIVFWCSSRDWLRLIWMTIPHI